MKLDLNMEKDITNSVITKSLLFKCAFHIFQEEAICLLKRFQLKRFSHCDFTLRMN